MHRLALCFLILLLALSLKAQEAYQQYLNLSYEEIDSLLMLEYQKGTYDKAIPLMQAGRAKAKSEFGEQDSVFAVYCIWGGILYRKTGQYDKALSLYIQVKNIYEKTLGKEHFSFANSLNDIALLHKEMGDYELALPLYIQAKNIFERELGREHHFFAFSLNNLAALHKSMGNYELALPLFIQAKNIKEKALGKEHPRFARSLNNLAALHESMGNYALALPLFIQAKNIYEKALGKEHPLSANSLKNIAVLYERMQNYELALPLFIQAKNIYEKTLGKEHPEFALSLNTLAQLHQKMGNYDKAWDLLEQVINNMSNTQLQHSFNRNWVDTLQKVAFQSNQHIRKTLDALGISYRLIDKDNTIKDGINKQKNIADLALFLLNKVRNQIASEKDKLRILAISNDWLQKSLGILSSENEKTKAFTLADQNKSILLLKATKSEATYHLGGLPDSLVRQSKKLLKQQSKLQAKLYENRLRTEKDSLRNILNEVNQQLNEFEQLIREDYPKYYKLKYQQVATKAQDIQALLDEQTALIEYVIGDSVVHIFCVTQSELLWEKVSMNKEQRSNYIQQLHESLSDYEAVLANSKQAYQKYTEAAYWFYEKLLAPVLKDKQKLKKLIIVTDGKLGHLPFEAFLVEPASPTLRDYKNLHYLLRDYRISYNYSASLWKENREAPAPKNNGQILGIAANYDTPIDSSILAIRSYRTQSLRQQLSPLPAAQQEVKMLEGMYQGFFAFDSLASERVVKAKARDFAVLHFATHGLLDEKRPILSSLAFTEDKDSSESNFLQAYEISQMELNAELVVLSACETGYGKFETGNGIASLARSFMYAGAPSLIVSLWQVNDEVTSSIIQKFYRNLTDGQAVDEALRQAKLDYIQSARGVMAHPAFWSPFIQIGKTAPVEIQRKGNLMPWVLGGLGAVVLLVLGVVWMRREA